MARSPFNLNDHNGSNMSPRADVPAAALFGPLDPQPDEAADWAHQTFEPAEPMGELIQQMYPDARLYNGRVAGEFDHEGDTDG